MGADTASRLMLVLLLLDTSSCLISLPLRRLRHPHTSSAGAGTERGRQVDGVGCKETESRKIRRTSLALLNPKKSEYYGEVSFGTPSQVMRILVDTGSADLWVLRSRYNYTISSTFRSDGSNVSITYAGSTRVSGYRSTDVLKIGNLTIGNQSFALITTSNYLYEEDYDGVLGLAFPALSSEGLEPPLSILVREETLREPTFSLYLSRNNTSGVAGEITFGGSDPKYYEGDFFYVDVLGQLYWLIAVDGIAVGGSFALACVGGCKAIVDSGTAFITGPSQEIRRVHASLGAWQRRDLRYEVNCTAADSLPDIRYVIRGRDFYLKADQYITKEFGGDSCVSVFAPLDVQSLWILGSVFMASYYTTFDFRNRRIGFAASKRSVPQESGKVYSSASHGEERSALHTFIGVALQSALLACYARDVECGEHVEMS